VVATAVGGTPEAILDRVTGLLVPPRNPVALAGAVIALLGDQKRRVVLGQAARDRVKQHFSVSAMVDA